MSEPCQLEAIDAFLDKCRTEGAAPRWVAHHPVAWESAYVRAVWIAKDHGLGADVAEKGAQALQAAASEAYAALRAPRNWSRTPKCNRPIGPAPRAKPHKQDDYADIASITRCCDLTANEVEYLDYCLQEVRRCGWRDRLRKPTGRNRAMYVDLFPFATIVRREVRADGLRLIANAYARSKRGYVTA